MLDFNPQSIYQEESKIDARQIKSEHLPAMRIKEKQQDFASTCLGKDSNDVSIAILLTHKQAQEWKMPSWC